MATPGTSGDEVLIRLKAEPDTAGIPVVIATALSGIDSHACLLGAETVDCGNGEVIRYDVDDVRGPLRSRKLIQLTGSGEDARLLDVDNDGDLELVVSNGFRDLDARIQIYDLDPVTGDPRTSPRNTIDELEGERMFYASIATGDLDGDGRPELIVGWKHEQDVNRAMPERAVPRLRQEDGEGHGEEPHRGDRSLQGRVDLARRRPPTGDLASITQLTDYFSSRGSGSESGSSLVDGNSLIGPRASFQPCWTIHDKDRSSRAASCWISLSISSGK